MPLIWRVLQTQSTQTNTRRKLNQEVSKEIYIALHSSSRYGYVPWTAKILLYRKDRHGIYRIYFENRVAKMFRYSKIMKFYQRTHSENLEQDSKVWCKILQYPSRFALSVTCFSLTFRIENADLRVKKSIFTNHQNITLYLSSEVELSISFFTNYSIKKVKDFLKKLRLIIYGSQIHKTR